MGLYTMCFATPATVSNSVTLGLVSILASIWMHSPTLTIAIVASSCLHNQVLTPDSVSFLSLTSLSFLGSQFWFDIAIEHLGCGFNLMLLPNN